MFDSLRRWTGDAIPEGEVPLQVTLDALDAGGVDRALISAWHGPAGPLIDNDEVAAFLFGSNHPMIAPAHALEGLEELGLDEETRKLYLGGNAERVVGLS